MEILITSVIAFASSNIDDIFILTLFYGNKKFKGREIMAGQLLGIIALIVISLVGSLIGLLIDQSYIGFLGLIPIYLGVKAIWALKKDHEANNLDDTEGKGNVKSNTLTVAGVTIANGGDNIGIYTPLFATLTWTNKIMMAAVFLVMTVLWCFAAKYLVSRPYVAATVDKYGHVITPFILILLGVYILYESGTFGLLTR